MSLFNKIFHKCKFCKSHLDTIPVKKWGVYGGLRESGREWYHQQCIDQICSDPEGAGHVLVDQAIDVIERLQEEKNYHADKMVKIKEACHDFQPFRKKGDV